MNAKSRDEASPFARNAEGPKGAPPDAARPLQDQILDRLRQCFDPEIPVNIYDLGLVYDVAAEPPSVHIRMTFTSESCPSAREIPHDIRRKLLEIPGVEQVDFEIVWDPPWHPRMIAPAARAELGIDEDALGD